MTSTGVGESGTRGLKPESFYPRLTSPEAWRSNDIEMCARAAALSIGTGLLAFCACALKGYFIPAIGKKPYQRRLLISWILTPVPILGVVLSECLLVAMHAQLPWS
jgi:hypothetical protein